MQKIRVFGLLGATFVIMALTFNNCGNVEFQKMAEVDKASVAEAAGEQGIELTEEEIGEIINQVPPEELEIIRPVTDLQDPANDVLYDIYKCGDGGVLICHFPDSVESHHELCVGRSAVKTHYDHLRFYGDNKQISDYLGSCRVAL